MQRINFITNFAPDDSNGGWNGVSYELYQGLSRYFDVNYVGPINPGYDKIGKTVSKLRRLAKLQGKFHFFSKRRLGQIADEVACSIDPTADFDFYHGATPWIAYDCPRPYGCFIDESFESYLAICQKPEHFLQSDLQRIYDGEAAWMKKAAHVFCGSNWAVDRAVQVYSIPNDNFRAVLVGGCADIPPQVTMPSGMNFLFISVNFIIKGGHLCAEAFQRVRQEFPEATLTFIGQCPPPEVLAMPGVHYAGFLRKTDPDEGRRFAELLSAGFALIHPTMMDANPLVLIEAGYHGCPSITTRAFGIPDLVDDGVTGYLIDPPLSVDAFVDKMLMLCRDRDLYTGMRQATREMTTTKLTWDAVTRRIADHILANPSANPMTEAKPQTTTGHGAPTPPPDPVPPDAVAGPRKRVAFVTNIPLDSFSGGFSAMNKAMFELLSLRYDVDYIGPVNPKPSFLQHAVSKALRVLGLGGDFYFFSEQRLEIIREEVESRLKDSTAEFIVFHGFTPWIHIKPSRPYIAWNDCTFWQYVHIYCEAPDFRPSDLDRLKQQEAVWLQNAQRVIFRSAWAAAQAVDHYRLDQKLVGFVGNYGFASPPAADVYAGSQDFLLVATNFQQKGGPVAVAAIKEVRQSHPAARLIIVGEHPGNEVLREPAVHYLGSLDKSDPAQQQLLDQTFANACCLIHPTHADTNPMVLIEAGYFGCPAISSRRYAIPELVVDGVSGFLMDDPSSVVELAGLMLRVLRQDEAYRAMRQQARSHMLAYYTRDAFRERLLAEIAKVATPASNRISMA